MAAFFPEVLDQFLSPAFLEGVRKKYHFDETQADEFQAVAEEMLPLMREEAFWERRVFSEEKKHQSEACSARSPVILLFVCCPKRALHLLRNSHRMRKSGVKVFASAVII